MEFVLARQGSDGLWRDFLTLAGEGADWPTGFVGEQLATAEALLEPLERAANQLVRTQHDDGGWGYHAGVPTDADSTAWVLLFLRSLGRRGRPVERAASCLARHQDAESGGIATYREAPPIRRFMGLEPSTDLSGWCSAHVEVTATAGRAFATLGGQFRDRAEAAWRYVRSRQAPDGSWNSYWWTSPHYPTLQAATLASDVNDHEALQRAVAWASRQQGCATARSGQTEPTAFALAATLALLTYGQQCNAKIHRVTRQLGSLQEADGSWPRRPVLRIPPPHVKEPSAGMVWRRDALGTGVVIADQHGIFTTAACIAALSLGKRRCR
jgi:Squalene cyclase